jgi:hypothetical protein
MSRSVAPTALRTNQIVNVIRNGVPLRCRVLHSCPRCSNVVFRHVTRTMPSAPQSAGAFLAVISPTQPVNDSGQMPHGTGWLELSSLTLVANQRGDGLELAGRPIEVELVADPRWN